MTSLVDAHHEMIAHGVGVRRRHVGPPVKVAAGHQGRDVELVDFMISMDGEAEAIGLGRIEAVGGFRVRKGVARRYQKQ